MWHHGVVLEKDVIGMVVRRNAIELDDGGRDNANPQKIKRWKQQRTKLMGDELLRHELEQKKTR